MKTERMVLLVTPADKAALAARAAGFGLSVSELIRQAALDYDPEEVAARAELAAFMPDFNMMVDNIHASFERMIAKLETGESARAAMDTAEYRDRVRQDLLNDPAIDWDAARRAFGGRERAA